MAQSGMGGALLRQFTQTDFDLFGLMIAYRFKCYYTVRAQATGFGDIFTQRGDAGLTARL